MTASVTLRHWLCTIAAFAFVLAIIFGLTSGAAQHHARRVSTALPTETVALVLDGSPSAETPSPRKRG
ncbi:hypothetical protein LQ948_10660 [Jiella sp. MQZ9-1]|nr:hypothetical protein [Jiella flava]